MSAELLLAWLSSDSTMVAASTSSASLATSLGVPLPCDSLAAAESGALLSFLAAASESLTTAASSSGELALLAVGDALCDWAGSEEMDWVGEGRDTAVALACNLSASALVGKPFCMASDHM